MGKTVLGGMIVLLALFAAASFRQVFALETYEMRALDDRVRNFLEKQKGRWTEWNVPASDGELLYNLIIKNNYKRALEIGTSTGHSAVWMAWALSRTGGKLITIEIDEDRYRTALANFEAAGLSPFIDARLADAHALVRKLDGPFDFIFCDADKDWYKNYFMDLAPKLEVGGCFAAHNVTMSYAGGIREFLDYVKSQPHFGTSIAKASREGVSLSYKKREPTP